MRITAAQRRIFTLLGENNPSGKPAKLNKAIGFLIIFSIVLAVLATEPAIESRHQSLIGHLDIVIGVLFLVEYLLRLWIAPLKSGNGKVVSSVIKYAFSPMAILDLIAIAPTFIGMINPQLYMLRVMRIIRLIRIARLGRSERFRTSIQRFHYAIASKKNELIISSIYTGTALFIGSVMMYIAEGDAQKDQFGSISRCLWWCFITVTTVGYGDVYPVTLAGKMIASVIALLGIAIMAVPIGIISSGFSDAMRQEDSKSNS